MSDCDFRKAALLVNSRYCPGTSCLLEFLLLVHREPNKNGTNNKLKLYVLLKTL